MKAILEFDLNDYEDRKEFLRASKAIEMSIVLFDLLHNTDLGEHNKTLTEYLEEYQLFDILD